MPGNSPSDNNNNAQQTLSKEKMEWLKSAFGIDVYRADVEAAPARDAVFTRERSKEYVDEEKKLGWRAKKPEDYGETYWVTAVSTEKEREERTLKIGDDGLLYDAEGEKFTGKRIYAIDASSRDLLAMDAKINKITIDPNGTPEKVEFDNDWKKLRDDHEKNPLVRAETDHHSTLERKST